MNTNQIIVIAMSGCDEPNIKNDNESNVDNEPKSDHESNLDQCEHYHRGCELLYPCCNEYYPCRFCHDNVWNNYNIPDEKTHCADRKQVTTMKCKYCHEVQNINDKCIKCEKIMGIYYCKICKLLDLIDKGQFHCDKCGLCRQGGVNNFEHCDNCGICFEKGEHNCKIKIDGQDRCPVCCIQLFDSVIRCRKMRCGHWIHVECFEKYIEYNNKCPICSKSIIVSDLYNQYVKEQITLNPMPEEYAGRTVEILCNDCNTRNKTTFHFIGHQCPDCLGFNTTII